MNKCPVSSCRRSRQDSSGSADSGVYSTGGSHSSTEGSHSSTGGSHSSTGAKVSGQGPFDLEQVKMQDVAPGLKTQLVNADEGIVDMCV